MQLDDPQVQTQMSSIQHLLVSASQFEITLSILHAFILDACMMNVD